MKTKEYRQRLICAIPMLTACTCIEVSTIKQC